MVSPDSSLNGILKATFDINENCFHNFIIHNEDQ